jgi:membrane-associated protease RseP (regulator of RpoE activity)
MQLHFIKNFHRGFKSFAPACLLSLAASLPAQQLTSPAPQFAGLADLQMVLQNLNGLLPMLSMRSSQGYLGVDIRDVTDDQLGSLKLKEARGAEIITVDHDAPAGKSGLRAHDVILQVDGQLVEGEEQFRRIMRETPAGRKIALLISRDGQQQTLNIQLANRADLERQAWDQHFIPMPPPTTDVFVINSDQPPPPPQSPQGPQNPQGLPPNPPPPPNGDFNGPPPPPNGPPAGPHGFFATPLIGPRAVYTGALLEPVGQLADIFGVKPGLGLLVKNIDPNSPAAAAGLMPGDVVTRINSTDVTRPDDWVRAVRDSKGKALQLTIIRNKQSQTLTITPVDYHHHGLLEVPPQLFDGSQLDIGQLDTELSQLDSASARLGSASAQLDQQLAAQDRLDFQKVQQKIAAAQQQIQQTQQKLNSPEFQQKMKDTMQKLNSPEIQQQFKQLQQQLAPPNFE